MSNRDGYVMAIDPGKSGAIVVRTEEKILAYPMPDDAEILEIIRNFAADTKNPVCYMELVSGYVGGVGQPGSAMFNFGDGFGHLRGALGMARVKLVLVRPQEWQRGIPGVMGEKPERKRALKEHAARMFPDLKVTLKTADALCLLEYAMADLNGLKRLAVAKPSKAIRYSEAAEAIAWCKANGWGVPSTGTKEFTQMVTYFREMDLSP